MSLYKIVQDWDDSAGLEAFHNANFRHWAKINNRPCDIPLPDPDMYIDDIEYNAVIDPEVVADLYVEAQQPAPLRSSFLHMNETIRDMDCTYNSKWNTGDGSRNAYAKNGNNHMHKTLGPHGNSNNEAGRKYGRNKDGVGCFGSTKRSSMFKSNFCSANSSWRNFRGKQNRIDHSEQTVYAGRPTSQQWKPTKSIGS